MTLESDIFGVLSQNARSKPALLQRQYRSLSAYQRSVHTKLHGTARTFCKEFIVSFQGDALSI